MKKYVVIYDSKYGSTQKYAQWIAEDLGADLIARKAATPGLMNAYEVIIYGGGLYAGGVSGLSFITKNYKSIKDRDVYLFTCGLADPNVPENVKSIQAGLKKAMPEEMQNAIEVFHFRGAMNYSNLSFVHRSMMTMVQKSVAKKDPASRSAEDIQMLETFGKTVDFTNPDAIKPLIDRVLSK
jgi:menaquinone-dependent protoporphyrinogen IX oxidase